MASRIKGITIEIGGDTTDLQKSLKSVDSVLKDTQTQLKDVNKLLKLDPTNTELLRQKQDLLHKSVDTTKQRLEELKKALATMESAPDADKTIEQQNALKREIIETEQALKGYEDELGKSNVALNVIGETSKKVAENTKMLSAAAAGVAGAMLGNAVNAAAAADDLNALAQKTGLTVEELQKMQYASDVVDVSVETMTGSISKMIKQVSSGNKAFAKLGVTLTDNDGNLRSSTEIWYETLEALGQVGNETERDALSMEIFGKSAMDLAGIVDDGGEALKSLGNEAQDLGLIMSQDMVDDANEMQDAIDKMKGRVSQAFLKMGSTLAKSLVPMMEKLLESITQVVQWFSEMDGTTQTVILVVLGLIAAISPLAGIISKITGIVSGLSAAFAFFTSPVGLAVAAIAALIAIGVKLYKNWDTIKEKMDSFKKKLTDGITAIADKFKSKIEYIIQIINNLKENFFGKMDQMWNKVYDTFNKIGNWIADKIGWITSLFRQTDWDLPSVDVGDERFVMNARPALNASMAGASSGAVNVNMTVNGSGISATELADIVTDRLTTTIRRNSQRW